MQAALSRSIVISNGKYICKMPPYYGRDALFFRDTESACIIIKHLIMEK